MSTTSAVFDYQAFLKEAKEKEGISKTAPKIKKVKKEAVKDAKQELTNDQEKEKLKLCNLAEDFYGVLCMEDKKWIASQSDIKRAYNKMVLKYHPDKAKQRGEEPDSAIFKIVQIAYEKLVDPDKRRAYDSQQPFDDSVPSLAHIGDEDDFYTVFGDAFVRYARWDERVMNEEDHHTPLLGDASTPVKEVQQFYDYWRKFKSWRKYDYLFEHNAEEADARDERRWMERENAKVAKKHKTAENKKRNGLVETAFKLDPRIRADKFQKKQEEERKRREAILARMKKEEEEKKAEAEKQRKQREEERENRKNEAQRKELRREKYSLFLEKAAGIKYNKQKATRIAIKAGLKDFDKLLAAAEKGDDVFRKLLDQASARIEAAKSKAKKNTNSGPVNVEWTPEELKLLSQGIIKYPGGVSDRWSLIRHYIGGTKTNKQIIYKVKNMQGKELQDQTSTTRQLEDSFSQYKKEKRNAKLDVQSDISQNWESQAKDNLTTVKPMTTNELTSAESWNNSQQKQLEDGLQKWKKADPKRWDNIAELVSDKTKEECIIRYKFICTIILKCQLQGYSVV